MQINNIHTYSIKLRMKDEKRSRNLIRMQMIAKSVVRYYDMSVVSSMIGQLCKK